MPLRVSLKITSPFEKRESREICWINLPGPSFSKRRANKSAFRNNQHSPQTSFGREWVRYSGSPIPMSFAEIDYPHQVLCLELDGERLGENAHTPAGGATAYSRPAGALARGSGCAGGAVVSGAGVAGSLMVLSSLVSMENLQARLDDLQAKLAGLNQQLSEIEVQLRADDARLQACAGPDSRAGRRQRNVEQIKQPDRLCGR
jgi:hypothetical protein